MNPRKPAPRTSLPARHDQAGREAALGDRGRRAEPTSTRAIRKPRPPSARTLVAIGLGALALDQATKTIATGALANGATHVWFLHLRLVANRGTLLGLIAPPMWLLTIVTLVIVAAAVRSMVRPDRAHGVAYALLGGGALGNLIDRYLERPGFPPRAVVDWLSAGGVTFNLADVFVVASVFLFFNTDAPQSALPSDTRRRSPWSRSTARRGATPERPDTPPSNPTQL